jgi:hypothetical protein
VLLWLLDNDYHITTFLQRAAEDELAFNEAGWDR